MNLFFCFFYHISVLQKNLFVSSEERMASPCTVTDVAQNNPLSVKLQEATRLIQRLLSTQDLVSAQEIT